MDEGLLHWHLEEIKRLHYCPMLVAQLANPKDNVSFSWKVSLKMSPNCHQCCSSPHYGDLIMNRMASQITSLTTVYSTIWSDADQRKNQSSASLAFVQGIQPGTGEFPAQMASIAENAYIWWRHHEYPQNISALNFLLNHSSPWWRTTHVYKPSIGSMLTIMSNLWRLVSLPFPMSSLLSSRVAASVSPVGSYGGYRREKSVHLIVGRLPTSNASF